MWARSPGAPPWWARSIIVIEAGIVLLALMTAASGARAQDVAQRLIARTREAAIAPLPSAAALRASCGTDGLCMAHRLLPALDGRSRLEPIIHPSTDVIRRVKVLPSVLGARRLADGGVRIILPHFGRHATGEIMAALKAAGGGTGRLEIDLRGNRGGDLRRMLRVAALFAGPARDVLVLRGGGRMRSFSLPAPPRRLAPARLVLITGPQTASSAEAFAAILRVHAKARITGGPTYGKTWLLRAIPVSNDWRLLIPAGDMQVPGASMPLRP